MAMTTRDFNRIADAFVDSYVDHQDEPLVTAGIDVALANVAVALASINPRFDTNRFLAAATKTRPSPLGGDQS